MHNSPHKKNEITKIQLEKFLSEEKKSLREVAKILGVTHKKIFTLAKKFGIERKTQVAKNCIEEIFEMHCNGIPAKEIAERVGCTRIRIYQILKRYDFSQRPEGEPQEVDPYRCPVHGIVRFRPCVACLAEGNNFTA